MSDVKAVVVRLPLSDNEKMALTSGIKMGGGAEECILAIGTPVAGGELDVVGYITDNRPFDTNTLTHWILYKHRQHDREYGVVCQSDAQAALATAQAEIVRLREALRLLLVDWEDCMGNRPSIGSNAARTALKGPAA